MFGFGLRKENEVLKLMLKLDKEINRKLLTETQSQRDDIKDLKEDLKVLEDAENDYIKELDNKNHYIEKLEDRLELKELELKEANEIMETNYKTIESQNRNIGAYIQDNKKLELSVSRLKKKNEKDSKTILNQNLAIARAEKECARLMSKVTVSEIAKRQLRELCIYKGGGRSSKATRANILVNEKINGVKVWNLTNLMGL
ncbi:MAG: hypothetical protein RR904_07150 [Bacilli bacterium]